ncbi:hypothetical protein WF787_03385 [Faecalibacterium sp. HTF-76H]|uniref:Uncharacterized protein n=1 Tax=Faecalibacterium taiwanense TaxID=3030638 RepID=A0AB35XU64_9FIRM
MTDYIISSKLSNEMVYACYRGRFWRWDGSIWKESHLMTQKFERARAADKNLTPQTFLTNGAEFAPLDEYEIDCAMLDALENANPCKNAPIEPVEEHPTPSAQCSDAATAAESQTAASPAAPEESNPTTELATAADAPGVPVSADENAPVPSSTAPTFDFGADDQTNALLLQDAQTFITGNMARIMAAKHAHDLTANHYQGSWGKWCAAVGISRDTGDRMVSVAAQCGNIQLEGKSILDVQPLKLLYAAAKPSTPEVVKQAVFTGDITTYKEYQELMAQLKAEKSRADAAEKSAQNARKENAYFKELVKSAEAQTHKDAEKREEAESRYESALADINGLKEQNAQLKERADSAEAREEEAWKMQSKAEARAKNAEGQLSGSRQVAEAAKLRADKLQEENAALKKQPIAAVVDEEEVDRRAGEKAYEIAAGMTADYKAQQEQDARDAYDSIILAGRSITSIVQSAKMQFHKLPDDQRETAINQFVHTLASAQGEVSACL